MKARPILAVWRAVPKRGAVAAVLASGQLFQGLFGPPAAAAEERSSSAKLRVIIETDAGGDPDDEQSLVRFLLYANEWDVEGIIATRPETRRDNRNTQRTGLGIVRAQLEAYGQVWPNLNRHRPGYPTMAWLWQRTVAGYNDSPDGVNLILEAVDRPDPRPVWYCNWGTDDDTTSSLKRALDKVLAERGPTGYAAFKNKLRLSSDDKFGDHTRKLEPPWVLWVYPFYPNMDGGRWYHRFGPLTAKAGGFDLQRDLLSGHGPLGALYPTTRDIAQKEGDTYTFLYLIPTGMNDPNEPGWGSWAGRFGVREEFQPRNPSFFWANQRDTWGGTTNRDNTLKRWAADLQNDFRARLDWCVKPFAEANHPPLARVEGALRRTVVPSAIVTLSAAGSTDPDGQALSFRWEWYPEAGACAGPVAIEHADSPQASFVAPSVPTTQTVHIILRVTDNGQPPLTRYQRVIVTVEPRQVTRSPAP